MGNILSEANAFAKIEALALPPFCISAEKNQQPQGPDWHLRLEWEGQVRVFAVEYKSQGTPKQIASAVSQIHYLTSGQDLDLLPMVMAPYLGTETLDYLLREGISGIDFSGNGVVTVSGNWLVYRTGKPNLYPARAPIKAIYSGTSSLVGRVLLLRPSFQKVNDVRDAIIANGGSIALSTVSKVLRGMAEDLLVSQKPSIRPLEPARLLDRLAQEYVPPEMTGRVWLRDQMTPDLFRTMCASAGRGDGRVVCSGQPIYSLYATSEPIVVAYTTSISKSLGELSFQSEKRFAQIELRETQDQRVYFDSRREEGIEWTSPIQVFCELSKGNQRDKEATREVRDLILREMSGQ